VAREAFIAQGLSSLEDFVGLTDEDITSMCSNARKPGGIIQNPEWVAGGNMPQMIPNPGAQVGHFHEIRLRQLRFYRNYLSIVQRPMMTAQAIAQATLARLIAAWALYLKIEQGAKDDDSSIELPEKLKNQDDARKILEDLDDYLKKRRNIQGVPMSYLIRDDENAPDIASDPGYATPSFDDEMIRRASYIGEIYITDNRALWSIVRHITHDGPGWVWVSTHARSMNGRQAYLDLKSHYLGAGFTNEITNHADSILHETFYDGKKRSFTFENYAELITKAFDDLTEAGETIDDQRKVRRLLSHIYAPTLIPAKTVINSDTHYRDNYQNTISFLKAQRTRPIS
jgi:hypothetical protein